MVLAVIKSVNFFGPVSGGLFTGGILAETGGATGAAGALGFWAKLAEQITTKLNVNNFFMFVDILD